MKLIKFTSKYYEDLEKMHIKNENLTLEESMKLQNESEEYDFFVSTETWIDEILSIEEDIYRYDDIYFDMKDEHIKYGVKNNYIKIII